VALCLDRLVHAGLLDLSGLVAVLSANPARVLGLPGGTLAAGSPGDVTVLDLGRRGKVDPEAFATKGRNTPFAGWTLKGAPAMTIVGGRVVWKAPHR
jgi:dihydroorotase